MKINLITGRTGEPGVEMTSPSSVWKALAHAVNHEGMVYSHRTCDVLLDTVWTKILWDLFKQFHPETDKGSSVKRILVKE